MLHIFCALGTPTTSDTEFFANLCEVQLDTDRCATHGTRTVFTKGAVQHLIEESGLSIAPGLSYLIQSQHAPSVQQSRACSIPLSNDDMSGSRSLVRQKYWHVA